MRVHTVLLVACSASSSRGLLCDCAAERACQNRDARLATISREIRQHASVDEWPRSRRLLSGENEAAALIQGHTYDGGYCYSFCCLKPSRRAPSSPASVIKALCRTFVFIAGVALFLGYCAILATGQPDSPALSAKAAAEETMRRRAVAEELLHAAAAREGVKPPQPFIVKVDSDSAPPPPRAFLWSLVWDAVMPRLQAVAALQGNERPDDSQPAPRAPPAPLPPPSPPSLPPRRDSVCRVLSTLWSADRGRDSFSAAGARAPTASPNVCL